MPSAIFKFKKSRTHCGKLPCRLGRCPAQQALNQQPYAPVNSANLRPYALVCCTMWCWCLALKIAKHILSLKSNICRCYLLLPPPPPKISLEFIHAIQWRRNMLSFGSWGGGANSSGSWRGEKIFLQHPVAPLPSRFLCLCHFCLMAMHNLFVIEQIRCWGVTPPQSSGLLKHQIFVPVSAGV